MSAAVVRGFLPGIDSFLGHTLWTFLFPASVEQLCPRPQVSLQITKQMSITLMWPAASFGCLLGVVLGFAYGGSLLFKAFATKARKGTFVWGFAFLWYGLMSLGGLFYHCIWQTRVFYLLDEISTACACISLLAMYGVLLISDDRSTKFRSSLLGGFCLVTCLSVLGGDKMRNVLYLGPASLAFILGACFVMVRASRTSNCRLALACAFLSAVMAVASVPPRLFAVLRLWSKLQLPFLVLSGLRSCHGLLVPFHKHWVQSKECHHPPPTQAQAFMTGPFLSLSEFQMYIMLLERC